MVSRPTTPGFKDDRYKELIGRLIARRKELGLSQKQLGERIGLHKQFISRVETGGRRLDVVEIVDYAIALEIEPAGLVSAIPTAAVPANRD